MADKTIKHFVFSRFFTGQNPRYPHDIYDVNFLSTQLPLTKNILRSLENQTNKNFEFVFLVNWKFFGNPRYEFVFETLKNSTTLPVRFISDGHIPYLLEEAQKEYDFVIRSSMDFDDFVYKDAIADVQSKVEECDSILSYGYCKGYAYFNGELYPEYKLWKGIGYSSILFSLIAKSGFVKAILKGVYHHVAKNNLKENVAENEIPFSESMFQQNTSTNAYIYFRHEFSQEYLLGHDKIKEETLLNNENGLTKKYLEEEFGFFYDLNSIK